MTAETTRLVRDRHSERMDRTSPFRTIEVGRNRIPVGSPYYYRLGNVKVTVCEIYDYSGAYVSSKGHIAWYSSVGYQGGFVKTKHKTPYGCAAALIKNVETP